MEVQVLKSHRNKSRGRNDKGPQDMDLDCIKNVITDLSAKACQTKDVLTEVDHPVFFGQDLGVMCFQSLLLMLRYLQFRMFSCEENVGSFQNIRKECRIKTFDGLGPFSYVCVE